MLADHDRAMADIPRERLEEMLIRTIGEVRRLRQKEQDDHLFKTLAAGLALGAALATAAFLLVAGLG